MAGGLELALWCDLRVADETAIFGVFCRRWGVPLIDGGTVRLPRLIGTSRAMDMILTGRAVDAQEAAAIGLANRVVPAGQALAAAQELGRTRRVPAGLPAQRPCVGAGSGRPGRDRRPGLGVCAWACGAGGGDRLRRRPVRRRRGPSRLLQARKNPSALPAGLGQKPCEHAMAPVRRGGMLGGGWARRQHDDVWVSSRDCSGELIAELSACAPKVGANLWPGLTIHRFTSPWADLGGDPVSVAVHRGPGAQGADVRRPGAYSAPVQWPSTG